MHLCDSKLGIENSMNRVAKHDKQNLLFLVEDEFNLLHLVLVVLFLEAGSGQELD